MSILTDGLLISVCLTAGFYCFILSRRLTRFSDTESGIGQKIAQLNAILEETRSKTRESQTGAKAVSERLARDLASARKVAQDLVALVERAESALDREFERRVKPMASDEYVKEKTSRKPKTDELATLPKPEASKADDADTSLEELPHDAFAQRDFDLADTRGEPQLGFLPNVTDTSSFSDLSLNDSDQDDDEANNKKTDGTDNLLKAERMAL